MDSSSSILIYFERTAERKHKSLFNISPDITLAPWNALTENRFTAQPIDVLWTLFLTKCYCTEATNSSICRCDENTFCKLTWTTIFALLTAENCRGFWWLLQCFMFYCMRVILLTVCIIRFFLSSRLRTDSNLYVSNTFCSVDRSDCRIQEPSSLSTKWYSHKLKDPALRYETATSNHEGHIVHVSGFYRHGQWLGSKIFASQKTVFYLPGIMAAVNSGYCTDLCVKPQNIAFRAQFKHMVAGATRNLQCTAQIF